ncbi:U2 small nuclear ribonucleoprotein B''-like, partial [Trifolium medium]|nr:U2 small nuclear ribonucleoprotein B''-like [Trifolium medium]
DERAGSDKKARGSAPSWPTPDSGVSSIHMPGIGNPAFNTNMIGYPPAQRSSALLNHSFVIWK